MSHCVAPRDAFGEALVELGQTHDRVMVLDADVATSTKTSLFREAFPDRFIQVGIAEQNMVGIAAGLATMGWIPFAVTFAVFASKRACDQVSISVAYPRLNVKISGAYGGIPTGKAGATHQSVEDVAIMRCMPHMTVLDPADAWETRAAVFAAAAHPGPVYLRCVRCPLPILFQKDVSLEIGKGKTLRDGDEVSLVSSGMMTERALRVAEVLHVKGVQTRVIHMPSIKPLDEGLILSAAQETLFLVTIENHSRLGGLGGAVAELLSEHTQTPLLRLGFPDRFGESGEDEEVFHKMGLSVEAIVERVMEFRRKRRRT